MNNRQILFLNMLVNHSKEFTPIDIFAKEFHVSQKTLRRDLDAIETYLEKFGGLIERKSGVGIKLGIHQEQMQRLSNHISYLTYISQNSKQKTWEKEPRRMDIALNLLLYSDEHTSLSSLAYQYYVSKSTIHHDLLMIEGLLERFSLKIKRTANGTAISGSEHDIRQAIVYILSYILDAKAILSRDGKNGNEGRETDPGILATILDLFREDDICFVNQLICKIEQAYNYKFDDREFINVSMNLLVMAYRLKNGWALQKECSAYGTELQDFTEVQKVVHEVRKQMLKHYNIDLPTTELKGVKRIILTTCLFDSWTKGEYEDGVFQLFSEDFIDAFTTITNINLRENPTFCENVISHINLMLNRLINGTSASNPLMELLIKDYQSTLNVCRIICCILSKKFRLPELSMDEISFLMLYILGEIVRQAERAKVLFVTELTKSVANLTMLRLQQHFPQWSFETCTLEEYRFVKDNPYDFCISTKLLDGENVCCPYVLVSPILGNRDFQNIQELFWKTNASASRYLLELVRIVNDLRDIGCIVNFHSINPSADKKQLINVSALKGIQYIYLINEQEENHCTFILDERRQNIECVYIDMFSLDFMLFSSKIVYLLDNCPNDIIPDFIYSFTEGEENV